MRLITTLAYLGLFFLPADPSMFTLEVRDCKNLALVDQDELEKKRLKTLEHQVKIFINVFPIVSSV